MNEICELVPSQKGGNKLNVHGYLMVKDSITNNIYHWSCEKRKSDGCKARATTVLNNGLHYLKKIGVHDHTPQASSANIAKAIAGIKRRAN